MNHLRSGSSVGSEATEATLKVNEIHFNKVRSSITSYKERSLEYKHSNKSALIIS